MGVGGSEGGGGGARAVVIAVSIVTGQVPGHWSESDEGGWSVVSAELLYTYTHYIRTAAPASSSTDHHHH